MTVAEFIQKLGEFDPALPIKAYDVDYGNCEITDVRLGTEVVFQRDDQGKLIDINGQYQPDHYDTIVIINDPIRKD